ncbi:Adenylosuccinate synthetase [Metarhizium anisopliae]|nr:Adenylosuccinate synthetase [Metarhizium anisopliae]
MYLLVYTNKKQIRHELVWAVSKRKILEKMAQNSRNSAKNGYLFFSELILIVLIVSRGRPLVDGVVVVDLVVLRYSTAINYYTALNLTKLDVLDTFETIKVAVAYKDPESGEELASYPTDPDILDRAHVVYHEMPGWKRPTTNVKTFDDLPKQAQDYVEVKWIGTGPDRESMIEK